MVRPKVHPKLRENPEIWNLDGLDVDEDWGTLESHFRKHAAYALLVSEAKQDA